MCRCCQSCLEDIYWNCFEEKFVYDESIANYNPEEDAENIALEKTLNQIQSSDNNNTSVPVCIQPLRTGSLVTSPKIHEEDYRRETKTTVSTLGPEILSVFSNSQIFQDHQLSKLIRINTKLTEAHSSKELRTPQKSDEDKLIRHLENSAGQGVQDSESVLAKTVKISGTSRDKCIKFTLSPESSPEGSYSHKSQVFELAAEDKPENKYFEARNYNEIILRPRLIDFHPHLGLEGIHRRGPLRSVKSVPYFNDRSSVSDTDIYSIAGSTGQISMTPEVPSISFLNLPKNYENTPTVEEYRESQSLYSIQAANTAKAIQIDYSMPRYFRRAALGQSIDSFSLSSSRDDLTLSQAGRNEKEKGKRLQRFRENLPPLLVHTSRKKDEAKQFDLKHY